MRTTTYILPLLLAVLLAGCTNEEYVGPQASAPITFSYGAGGQTRAAQTDLETLVKDFRVYGINGSLNGTTWTTANTVMDNYVVWWNENTANTTETNSTDWEYVGSYNGNSGLAGDDALKRSELSADEKTRIAQKQFIKYWDYGQPYHIFWAVAKAGTGGTFTANAEGTIVTHTIDGLTAPTGNNPSTCLYYTAPVVVDRSKYKQPVQLPFVCLGSRIRIGFYEVIPGYAVKDVKFYNADDNSVANCTAKGDFVSSASLTLTYNLDEANTFTNPTADIALNADPITSPTQQLGGLNYTFADDNMLTGTTDADKIFVARSSTAPTYAGQVDWPGYYTYILPFPANTKPLTLKCDYTLLSTDGNGQEIKVTGATATVPAEYCKWQSNHSYTYLFKFNDEKLKPITFVAVSDIDNTTDNQQGTITTMGDYSITTYQEGSVVEGGIDYVTMKDMEVTVVKHPEDGSAPEYVTLNSKDGTGTEPLDYVIIYHQSTTKEWVVETTTSTDTEPRTGVYLEIIESVNNDGDGIAHFIPDMTGTYRIEYWHKEAGSDATKLATKIVKIKGLESDLEEYDKWQSGASGTTTW